MLTEVGKVRDRRVNFCEIADSGWLFCTKSVGFGENLCLLQLCKKVNFRAVELDVCECAAAEHVTPNTHMRRLLSFGSGC